MSHPNQFGTSGSNLYEKEGLDRVHHFDHTTANDPTWHDELDEGLTRSGAHPSRNPQSHRSTQTYDEVIYTEKVTKELDSEGRVISTNVERGGPRASEYGANEPTSGARVVSGSTRVKVFNSDDFGRTGPSQFGTETERLAASEAREHVPGQTPLPAKVMGQAERAAGKTTTKPNKFSQGEQSF
ncbi:hypothetical protein EST38_g620 [Candolleomyces aberdarensis]|uniref:Uncharacterized protein n=1 Tax=Candolleomyces aberdarensis TaxID=2316362 RepID=A0A4Q2DY42_9AGAR|nr:hypothetical protein EST38_g620 [Candolleomyces aberdarensis]